MFKKLVPLFIIISFLFGVICFAEEEIQSRRPIPLDLEWSDYGLNFEWVKDKKLLKEMNLTTQQEEELNNIFSESTQTVKTQEEIKVKENELKSQIELIHIIKIKGQEEVKTDMTEVESLIDQINKLRNEQFKIRMSAKAKLKILLTEEQRDTLHRYFRKKEEEQREKMREQMGGREGGGRGGRRGGGGMPPS